MYSSWARLAAIPTAIGAPFWYPETPESGTTYLTSITPTEYVANGSFMVGAAARGRGVGRLLGQAALDHARAAGFRAMQFNAVVEANSVAVALWGSLGFEIVGTVPEAFDHPTQGPVGLHIMYRRL